MKQFKKEVKRMNCKSVIQEQIRELQKVQDKLVETVIIRNGSLNIAEISCAICTVARTITELSEKSSKYAG